MVQIKQCRECEFLDDIDSTTRNPQRDMIYCLECDAPFERRMKPWNCKYSPLYNGKNKRRTDV